MKEIFYISKANSIPFVDRGINKYITEDNALSFEGKQFLSKKATWNFKPSDQPTIQIQSNLSNIKAKIYKDAILQETIDAVLKIENLNQNITLDCEVISLEESINKGLKFTSGNIYDNSIDLNVLETYNVFGNLPDFTLSDKNIIGKNITIDTTDYEILSIIYDEAESAWCLEIDTTTLTNDDYIMSLDYDIEAFNVYEIPFDFEQYNNSNLLILIEAETESEQKRYKVSEHLSIGFFEGQIEIQYAGLDDKDIFYSTGIKHLLRTSYLKIIPYTAEENENQTNDNSVYLVDSQTNEGFEYFLGTMTFGKYRQIVLALNHSQLFIDSTGFVIDGAVTKEDNEETNLVDVSFKVLKSNADFEAFENNSISAIINGNNTIVNNNNQII
tara:strand:+ start:21049 stop:22206 length:1158 start_codon:yes stop_codon:yes gene_type:complete